MTAVRREEKTAREEEEERKEEERERERGRSGDDDDEDLHWPQAPRRESPPVDRAGLVVTQAEYLSLN